MKSKFSDEGLSRWVKSGTAKAIALAGFFWVSQWLAWYFVSGSLFGAEPKILGAVFLVVFALFFILHVFRPFSKSAAIFGLCSLGVWIGFTLYLCSPSYRAHTPPVQWFVLVSVGLALGGMVLDERQCRHLAIRAGTYLRPSELKKAIFTAIRRVLHAAH